jgi:hypothetical protein
LLGSFKNIIAVLSRCRVEHLLPAPKRRGKVLDTVSTAIPGGAAAWNVENNWALKVLRVFCATLLMLHVDLFC